MNQQTLAPHAKVEVDELHLAKMRLELAAARYREGTASPNCTDHEWTGLEDAHAAAKDEFRRILSARAGMDADEIEGAFNL